MKTEPYLIYASLLNGIGFCQWEAVSGFMGCQNVQVKDARHVDIVVTKNGAYALAAVANNLVVYKNIFERSNKPYTCNAEQKNSLKKWKIYLFRYLLTFSVKFIIVRMNFNCKNASVNMQNYKL